MTLVLIHNTSHLLDSYTNFAYFHFEVGVHVYVNYLQACKDYI